MINIAVLGYGTVGSGVVEVIRTNHELINKRAGEEIKIKYVLDLREFPGDPVEEILVHDFEQIVNDPEVKIVVEVMGGTGAAYTFTKRALEAGKSVCTSNKALVAKYGPELMEIAKEKKINFLFEASCGGGNPLIPALNGSLTAGEIDEVSGILNGTTNYMLDKMITEGADFNTVLKEAQEKGYAEADPTADVEGQDACRKIAILSSLAYGKFLNFENVYTEGITKITDVDFKYAEKMGVSIKLFGTSRIRDGKVSAYVAPVMINSSHPLYGVRDVFNGIMVRGNMLGVSMFYGSGAGKLPTASAVIADIIEAAQNLKKNVPMGWGNEKQTIEPMENMRFRYFVRLAGSFRNKEQDIRRIFGHTEVIELYGMDEFAVLTPEMEEGAFRQAVAAYDALAEAHSDFGIKQTIRAMM